jgi:L-threonylcarbamoyladenylate synthase
VRRLLLPDLLASADEISRFRELLASGGVAALPTETFYALAADPTSDRGVPRIFEIKGRDDGKPLLVLFSSRGELDRLGVSASPQLLDRFFEIWPAPLTVILPLRAPIAASRGRLTLAVRIPDSAPVRELLARIGPLTGTSANRSGASPLSDPDDVAREMPDVDLVVDGGQAPGDALSTIVDATVEPARVLRPGAFRWKRASHALSFERCLFPRGPGWDHTRSSLLWVPEGWERSTGLGIHGSTARWRSRSFPRRSRATR